MAESVVLNDGETSEFALTDEANGIVLRAHSYTPPRPVPVYASSVDTEGQLLVGEPSFENRVISAEVEVFGASSEAVLAELQAVVALIGREGGTWTYTTPDGAVAIYDLVTWDGYEPTLDITWTVAGRAMVSIAFAAKPFGRGTPTTLSDRTETTAPALIFTETAIDGDVPALARLVVDEDQGVDQGWMIWGVRSRYYSNAASAALLIQAEDLTTQGGSTKTAGATGASGSGSNVVRNTDLTTSFVSILSGQLSASSTYLSHVGTYRVFARVYCPTGNTGTVEVALEWAEGDFRRVTRNATVEYESAWEGSFRLLDLGLVSLTEVIQGTQRWEPRITARSTVVGDEIDVDYLMFVPVDEAAGEISASLYVPTPTAFVARDEFDQTAGALTGKTLPTGGTWTGAGDADDFQVSGGTITRTSISDNDGGTGAALLGRFVYPSTPSAMTSALVQARLSRSGGSINDAQALLLRRSSNTAFAYLRVDWIPATGQTLASPRWTSSGTFVTLGQFAVPFDLSTQSVLFRFVILADGRWATFAGLTEASLALLGNGQDAVFATGGALASGAPGIFDSAATSTAGTRTYDDFAAWVPNIDAACFASQSLEVRWDGVIREDSAGAIWTPVSSYEGDLARIPCSGPQGRTVETIVKFSRNPPGEGADSGIDDLSARYTVTPRWLTVPS